MPNRVQLKAETRELLGKKVGRLRRAGILPATVYGHRVEPRSIQVEALAMRDVIRRAGSTQLIDLVVDGGPARPVLIRQTTINPKYNALIHVEFFQANLREKMTTHLPLHFEGDSPAVAAGGILLTVLDHIDVESLPQDVPPGGIAVDISGISDFNGAVHAGDLTIPPGLTLVTSPDEVVAKVNPPIAEEVVEQIIAEAEPLPNELGGDQAPADSVPEV